MEKFQMALRISLSLILLLFISCGDSNRATQSVLPTPVVTYTPGEIVSDLGGHIQYYVGNTPIIITVPHDGDIMPPSIPDRTGNIKKAENTLGIAEYFYNTFTSNGSSGLYPHIIINNINRSRLDLMQLLRLEHKTIMQLHILIVIIIMFKLQLIQLKQIME